MFRYKTDDTIQYFRNQFTYLEGSKILKNRIIADTLCKNYSIALSQCYLLVDPCEVPKSAFTRLNILGSGMGLFGMFSLGFVFVYNNTRKILETRLGTPEIPM